MPDRVHTTTNDHPWYARLAQAVQCRAGLIARRPWLINICLYILQVNIAMDGAASCAPGRAGALVRTGLTALLWLLVAFGVGVFSFFYLVTPTRWFNVYNKELIEFRSTLVLPYNFKLNSTTGRTTPILSGTISFLVSYLQGAYRCDQRAVHRRAGSAPRPHSARRYPTV